MKTVTLNAVRTRLDSLLRRVAAGEEIEIVERKRPLARLVPPHAPKIDWAETFSRLDAVWGGKPLPGKAGSEIIRQGRR